MNNFSNSSLSILNTSSSDNLLLHSTVILFGFFGAGGGQLPEIIGIRHSLDSGVWQALLSMSFSCEGDEDGEADGFFTAWLSETLVLLTLMCHGEKSRGAWVNSGEADMLLKNQDHQSACGLWPRSSCLVILCIHNLKLLFELLINKSEGLLICMREGGQKTESLAFKLQVTKINTSDLNFFRVQSIIFLAVTHERKTSTENSLIKFLK